MFKICQISYFAVRFLEPAITLSEVTLVIRGVIVASAPKPGPLDALPKPSLPKLLNCFFDGNRFWRLCSKESVTERKCS